MMVKVSMKIALVTVILCIPVAVSAATIHGLARGGTPEQIQTYLQQNKVVSERTQRGRTPLMIAASHNKPGALSVLIANGASVSAIDNRGWTALFYAARYNRARAIKVLLENGADVKRKDIYGRTPLMVAAYRSGLTAVKPLISAGGSATETDKYNRTPLLYAAASNYERMPKTRYFIKLGASMDHRDRWGRNGFDYLESSRPPSPPEKSKSEQTSLTKGESKHPTDVFVQGKSEDQTTQFFNQVIAPFSGGAEPLSDFFRTLFQFGSIILKFALGIIALWKAGEIGYYGSERIKDFGFVALAFLLYFMLPYIYRLAKKLGGSFG